MDWHNLKNILCIRPDNMGDLIMTAPALRALKETFQAKITVLTSTMAKGIVPFIPEIDDVIIFDLPWVKTADLPDKADFDKAVALIKSKAFDAAVIFTVYSQSALPTAMLPYMAGTPNILAYCRENPYQLINHWVPDKEPYEIIKHQVQRDLDLVAAVGAFTSSDRLSLTVTDILWANVKDKLSLLGVDTSRPWLILHPGVSEKKREYPLAQWAEAARELITKGYQIVITGSATEQGLTDELQKLTGEGSFSAGGLCSIDEFICVVKKATLILSVNTGTIHIAAATGTPVVVLYAQTNPQHTPWGVPNKVLEFPVPENLRSKNQVIAHVNNTVYYKQTNLPSPEEVVKAVEELLSLQGLPTPPSPGTPNESRAIAAS